MDNSNRLLGRTHSVHDLICQFNKTRLVRKQSLQSSGIPMRHFRQTQSYFPAEKRDTPYVSIDELATAVQQHSEAINGQASRIPISIRNEDMDNGRDQRGSNVRRLSRIIAPDLEKQFRALAKEVQGECFAKPLKEDEVNDQSLKEERDEADQYRKWAIRKEEVDKHIQEISRKKTITTYSTTSDVFHDVSGRNPTNLSEASTNRDSKISFDIAIDTQSSKKPDASEPNYEDSLLKSDQPRSSTGSKCSMMQRNSVTSSLLSVRIERNVPNESMAIQSGASTPDEERKELRVKMLVEVGYIIQELHDVERRYIETLRKGIQNYMLPFDDEMHKIPALLHGQKFHIFRNIQNIVDFHENIFYPAILECGTDVIRLSGTISWFLKTEQFYPYVLYAVNNKRAERIVEKNMEYFHDRRIELKEKLDVNSFLLQPIQRLPRYQLLLLQLIKQLGKCLPDKWVRDQIALCSQAEIQMQHMLNRVNVSISLNDFQVDDDELQILHLGIFKKAFSLDVYDHHNTRIYQSKLFLLQKGIVITSLMAKMELQFRQFIPINQLAVREVSEFRLDLYDVTMPDRNFCITSDYESITELRNLLEKHMVHDDVVHEGDTALKGKTPWYRSQKSRATGDSDDKKDRKPKPFKHQGSATWYSLENDAFQKSAGPTLHRLLNSEKNYINMLNHIVSVISLTEPQTRPMVIETQLHNVNMLRRYHRDLVQQLERANGHLGTIYDAYTAWIERTHVPNQMYAANCASVFEALCMTAEFRPDDDDVRNHMHFPYSHMERQRYYLRLVKAEVVVGAEVPKVKMCDGVEWKLHESTVLVKDNLMLNLLKASLYSTFGRVIYSDSVTMDDMAHRLLVLETGLACVKTTVEKISVDQDFAGLVFAMSYAELTMKERVKLKSLEFVINGRDIRKMYFVSSTKRHDMKKVIKRMIKGKTHFAGSQVSVGSKHK